jgi:spore germination protein YaaH
MKVLKGAFISLGTFLIATAFCASMAQAATRKLEFGGWIPYWRVATGTLDVIPHINQLSEVSPFGYSVASDGTVYDTAMLSSDQWKTFIGLAKYEKVRVIPAVTWSNGDQIQTILSDTQARIKLEDDIAILVKTNGWDGIDIDFENKKPETKNYFSTFLKGLYQRMGPKWVYCSVEPRTPLTDEFDTIPTDVEYANDLAQINKYCDRVEIMAYDQGTADIRLNATANGQPYAPVSDPKWVEDVINLMAQTISKKKIILGVPTYGYEYNVTPLPNQGYRYDLLWSFDQNYALNIAAQIGLTPTRNLAGELSFVYRSNATDTPAVTAPDLPPAADRTPAHDGSVPETAFSDVATAPALEQPFNLVWWSDASAVADKVSLARKLGLRGVSVFKFDGGEDQNIWNVLH